MGEEYEMIRRSRDLITDGISTKLLESCISEYRRGIERLNKLDEYYRGEHEIKNRVKRSVLSPNNKLVNNYPKYITDTACGYVLGNPIVYKDTGKQDLTGLQEYFKSIDIDTHDAELEKDLSVFGIGYELLYMDKEAKPKLALMDPRSAFVVYDDTVECNPLFGVTYYPQYGEDGTITKTVVKIYTENKELTYTSDSGSVNSMTFSSLSFVGEKEHYFNGVPLLQYWNNEEGMGDFEGVLSLVDAYNILQSDRINDKEQFLESILLVINMELTPEKAAQLKEEGIMHLLKDGDARYVTKTLNESETQVLANAVKDDIHKFSHTPDFTDEKFSGNTSGVAMAYKLLSLENLAKVKERFFKAGLRERLKLLSNINTIKGQAKLNVDTINIVMNRTLPVNELETAQMISLLKDTVSLETLLSKLPFIENTETEAKAVREQRKQAQEDMMLSFNRNGDNDDIDV